MDWQVRAAVPIAYARLQVFVDGPLFVARGTPAVRLRELAAPLAWISAVGFALAWHKAAVGAQLVWIGAPLRITDKSFHAGLAEAKVLDTLDLIETALRKPVVPRRALQSLAGKLAFVAGLVVYVP